MDFHQTSQGSKYFNFIFKICSQKFDRPDNLGTVMSLYSRGTFGKDSSQWTKCVVKYVHDVYTVTYFQICLQKPDRLDNLGTVMSLYSRGTFGKDSSQWTLNISMISIL